jgi:K+-transporting ATPase KdpF subunit
MVTFYWIGGVISVLLLGYLVFALLKPEALS